MKYLVPLALVLMLSGKAFSMGDPTVLPNNPEGMTNTVGTLNQVTDDEKDTLNNKLETKEERNFSTQDIQEQIYQEDQQREEEEWEETKHDE